MATNPRLRHVPIALEALWLCDAKTRNLIRSDSSKAWSFNWGRMCEDQASRVYCSSLQDDDREVLRGKIRNS